MQGIVKRLEKHVEICRSEDDSIMEVPPNPSTPQRVAQPGNVIPKTPYKKGLGTFVSSTTKSEKERFDKNIAKFFFGTDTPFNRVEHPTFKKAISELRPSYQPPNRKELAGPLLDKVHDDCKSIAADKLCGKYVTLMLDGWSNVNHEPIVCVSACTTEGEVFLLETIDTEANAHTAEYLQGSNSNCHGIRFCSKIWEKIIRCRFRLAPIGIQSQFSFAL